MAKVINKSTEYSKGLGNPVPESLHGSNFPTVRLEGPDNLDLPDDGVITVKYHKLHEEVRNKGKENEIYSCTLEVKHLVSVKKDSVSAPAKSNDDAGKALDKIAQAKHEAKEAEEGY